MHVLNMRECLGMKYLFGKKCRSRHALIDCRVLCCLCWNEFIENKILHVTDGLIVYVHVIDIFFWNIILPMINWKTGICSILLFAALVLHKYAVSDMLLTLGNI